MEKTGGLKGIGNSLRVKECGMVEIKFEGGIMVRVIWVDVCLG